jgi:hypothetical protein
MRNLIKWRRGVSHGRAARYLTIAPATDDGVALGKVTIRRS